MVEGVVRLELWTRGHRGKVVRGIMLSEGRRRRRDGESKRDEVAREKRGNQRGQGRTRRDGGEQGGSSWRAGEVDRGMTMAREKMFYSR